jgi:hypothetical protein
MNRTHSFARIAVAALLALLAAPLAFGVGTGGTGLRIYAHGALSLAGGVVVKGITFDPSQAGITINGNGGRSVGDLKAGMVAGVDGNVVPGQGSGVANSIQVTRVVLGAVSEVTPGAVLQVGTGGTGLRLKVAGLYVYLRPDTVVEGCGSLASLPIGTMVDVYGYSDGVTGTVDATRIECVGPAGEVELHGVASAITATSIVVQGVTVDTTGASFVGFSVPIAAGDRVEVEGTATADGVVAATVTFESDDADSPNGEDVEVEDAISAVISPLDFVVDKFEIDATNAKFSGGTVADIAVGRVVHVEGVVVNGILNAKSVEFDDGEAGDVGGTPNPTDNEMDDVDGPISAFTSVANFVVDGITVDATGATFVNGAATDLAVGKVVRVLGVRTGTTITAAMVIFVTGEVEDVDGAITAFTSQASFVVDGITIDATGATFVNGAATDLAVGKVVKVLGTLTGMTMKATTVTFITDGSPGDDGSGGGGSKPDPGDDGGKSGTPGTTPPPAGGDEGGGQPGAGTREVEGRVLSVISPGVFTIGSLQVDARGARFSGGSASSIHQGVQVHATGTIKSGVLTATRVEIDD